MDRRLEFHEVLVEILGSRNVYFQPPSSIRMEYPCIVYHRSVADQKFANNGLYGAILGYLVTLITRDPDDSINQKLLSLSMCNFNSHYTSDNLNHDVYTIYY